ncbi:DUF2249 domain-containing protein [Mucilaginibacter ginsenosidivorans]|uniref:DUF2249 domain-containing protein n=1 Tax=Mucilaginibacter ginsenosidivorans TaxID=398053 RepID=A0A5B8UTW8_9SPHI|nr:DUF2249 domain-containing protein [Mucilaginibacter ginsenosidivorans]QEC62362.1 DUF2249 domain-containing protein [Mucilaginibacter ginsenosidivorans]
MMELTINPQTKIGRLLEVDRDLVIRTLVGLNKKFSKLKNPLLRSLLVKRVSIADACKISKTELTDFMRSMKQIGFKVTGDNPVENNIATLNAPFREPLDYFELDVRPMLARDKDPLKEILACIKQLEDGQGLKLINTFEPLPLIHLLADKGFSFRVEQPEPNLIVTYFSKAGSTPDETATIPLTAPAVDNDQFDRLLKKFDEHRIIFLDVRQLEMPKPMLAILEQTPNLVAGSALYVYHKKIPVYLLPELEKQGLSYVFKKIGPTDVNMLIYKK